MHNMAAGDSHTRVSYRRNPNFCERIGNSLVGIIFGFGILLVSSGLLFWNEGRAVQTARSLDEGLNVVVPLQTISTSLSQNNGKLVHLSGPLKTEKILYDPMYGISVPAVKLRRNVEMYQWVEHESKREYNEGGQTRTETTYSYSLEWRKDLIRSSSFDNAYSHENPTSMPVTSTTHTANKVFVGAFILSEGLVGKISSFTQLVPTSLGTVQDPNIKIYMGKIYHSFDPSYPKVGDLRVTFEYAGLSQESGLGDVARVSIVARQVNQNLLPYGTEAGDILELLYDGEMSAKEMFGKEQTQNTMMTWGIRFGGWLLMFVGFGCITSIITTLVDWLPIIRELVTMGVVAMNLAFSISLSLTVIALGWIRYRPFLGLTILMMAAAPFFISKLRPRSRAYDTHRHA